MTTIAYDGKTIAADGLSVSGTERRSSAARKVISAHGRIYAFTGLFALFPILVEWHAAGADPSETPEVRDEGGWTLIVIESVGPVKMYTRSVPYPEAIDADKFAVGSGQDYALGALHAGLSAKDAVEIAAKIDTNTGGEIIVLDIHETLAPAFAQAAE